MQIWLFSCSVCLQCSECFEIERLVLADLTTYWIFECRVANSKHAWALFEHAEHMNADLVVCDWRIAHCNTLQHTATHCNLLQHTAAHCNTLQHTEHCTLSTLSTLRSKHTVLRLSVTVLRLSVTVLRLSVTVLRLSVTVLRVSVLYSILNLECHLSNLKIQSNIWFPMSLCHVPLKTDQFDWEWRMRLDDTSNFVGCTKYFLYANQQKNKK